MNLVLVLIVLLLIFGGLGGSVGGYWPAHYGYAGSGIGLVLLIVLLVILFR